MCIYVHAHQNSEYQVLFSFPRRAHIYNTRLSYVVLLLYSEFLNVAVTVHDE